MREHKDITFIVLASVSISLIVIGFFVPPMGKIDGSVLQAAGIIAGMYALKQIPAAILSGKEIKMKYGNASMAIGDGADIAKMEESENE